MLIVTGSQNYLVTSLGELSILTDANNIAIGIILIAVALMSMYSMRLYKHQKNLRASLLLSLPQQFILMLSMMSAFEAINVSHYADGVERPQLFIFIDQLPAILAAILHTLALFYYFSNSLHNKLLRIWAR